MEQQTATQAVNIDSTFAVNQEQIYADKPLFGALFRVNAGQPVYIQYVNKSERLTLSRFLEQKNISEGRFMLKTTSSDGVDKEIPFQVNKNADSGALNPFTDHLQAINNANNEQNGLSTVLKDQLEAEIRRLKTNLEEESSKRREVTDDLFKTKQLLSSDNTESAVAHQKEILKLKETHRTEVDELKQQLSDYKMELKIKELGDSGEKSFGNRLLDILQTNLSDDFLAKLASNIGKLTGNATQPTQAQMQQAITQAADAQRDVQNTTTPPASEPENNPQKVDWSKFNTGEPTENGQKPTENSQNTTENGQKPTETLQNGPQTIQNVVPQPISPQQMAQIKQQFLQGLKNAAFEALTADNDHLKQYATVVRNQMALFKEQGVNVDTQQWIQLTKMLANKAASEEISPQRVATVVNPLLSNVPSQYRSMLALLDSAKAATMLFRSFNIEASPQVKDIVTKVLDIIKNN